MKQGIFKVKQNKPIAPGVYKMRLEGDGTEEARPGQFINIKISGKYLRRPLSVCDAEKSR